MSETIKPGDRIIGRIPDYVFAVLDHRGDRWYRDREMWRHDAEWGGRIITEDGLVRNNPYQLRVAPGGVL